MPGESQGKISNLTGQSFALRSAIKPGDVVVMPMKTTKKIAIGICTSGYRYDATESDPTRRHQVGVEWKRTDVPRAAIKDDLLYTLGGAMTVFRAVRNSAEDRLRAVMETGVDPGSTQVTSATAATATSGNDSEDVTDPVVIPTLQSIRDRVQTHLIENFKGHKLTHLVAEILRVKGFTCEVSPEGPDGGVDILAGSGPLGLDAPKVIVEVKSEETQVSALVVRGLTGAITTQGASQGLLVAWGGLNKQAQREISSNRLSIRVWEADQVIDELFATYDQLPEETRRLLPLKRAWVLDEE